jgi:hypothetical protein
MESSPNHTASIKVVKRIPRKYNMITNRISKIVNIIYTLFAIIAIIYTISSSNRSLDKPVNSAASTASVLISNSSRQEVIKAYLVKNSLPVLWVSNTNDTVTPNESIIIYAQDNDGINHIGYAWDSDSTTPVYNSAFTGITAPSSEGTHTLHVYAKDNSKLYTFTGWIDFIYLVTNNK